MPARRRRTTEEQVLIPNYSSLFFYFFKSAILTIRIVVKHSEAITELLFDLSSHLFCIQHCHHFFLSLKVINNKCTKEENTCDV